MKPERRKDHVGRTTVAAVLEALSKYEVVRMNDRDGNVVLLRSWRPEEGKPYALFWEHEPGVVGSARALAVIFVKLVGRNALREVLKRAS